MLLITTKRLKKKSTLKRINRYTVFQIPVLSKTVEELAQTIQLTQNIFDILSKKWINKI